MNKEIEKVARNVEEKSRRELAPYLGFPQSVTEQNCQKKKHVLTLQRSALHCNSVFEPDSSWLNLSESGRPGGPSLY